MKVKLLPWQSEVAKDPHRFRVVCAGRRAGKSVLSRMIALKWATENTGLYWIVSPTYRQSKMIHWAELDKEIPKSWIAKKNEQELSVLLKNGSKMELKGAENPDALRGVKLRGLVIDEIASIRGWEWLWGEVLRPTLTDYEAPAIFISTPKGYNHFHDLYELGQRGTGSYKSWQFTTYDNPRIPRGEIERARGELTEDTFAQEYLADFRKATGLAFKSWDRRIHLISPFDVPDTWVAARGIDYGSAHPTASVRVRIDYDGNWFVDKSYRDSGRTIKEHADAIRAQDYGMFVPIWGDPSGGQWFTEFDQHNLHIQPANKEIGQGARGWVEYCVESVNQMLKPIPGHTVRLPDERKFENAPRLFVFNTAENKQLVREMETLSWRETRYGTIVPVLDEDATEDGHFDLVAALRYLAVSYKPASPVDQILPANDISKKDWSFK